MTRSMQHPPWIDRQGCKRCILLMVLPGTWEAVFTGACRQSESEGGTCCRTCQDDSSSILGDPERSREIDEDNVDAMGVFCMSGELEGMHGIMNGISSISLLLNHICTIYRWPIRPASHVT